MTITELENILKNYSVQCEYSHFSNEVKPPFMVYLYDSTDNEHADNNTYYVERSFTLELYTRKQNVVSESEKLEDYLTTNKIRWERSSTNWIDEEKIMQSVYTLRCEL